MMAVFSAWEQWEQGKKRLRTTAFKWEHIGQLNKEAKPVTFFLADSLLPAPILVKRFFWGSGELKPSKNNGEKFPGLRRALCLTLSAPGLWFKSHGSRWEELRVVTEDCPSQVGNDLFQPSFQFTKLGVKRSCEVGKKLLEVFQNCFSVPAYPCLEE